VHNAPLYNVTLLFRVLTRVPRLPLPIPAYATPGLPIQPRGWWNKDTQASDTAHEVLCLLHPAVLLAGSGGRRGGALIGGTAGKG